MSQLISFTGEEDFYHGGSIFSNLKEAGHYLSLDHHVDFFLPSKRARISAPFVVGAEMFEQKKRASIDALPDECLFEILRRLSSDEDRSVCASVSKKWLMLLSSIRRDERSVVSGSNGDLGIDDDGFLSRSVEGRNATDVRLAAIAVGIHSLGGLGKLKIKGSDPIRGVTDLGLKSIARCCPALKVLKMWDVPSVGDEGLAEIGNGCHQLEELDLLQCPGITDKGLAALVKGCPNLASLSIDSCPNIGNEGLQAIGKFCHKLKAINIKDCPLVGDQGIANMLSSTVLSQVKLSLQGLNITDLSLAYIGHFGKSVAQLDLVGLQNITEKGFWVLGRADGLQKLHALSISSCLGITDLGLDSIAKGCPNLKEFSLSKSAYVSDHGMLSFAKTVIRLESLRFEECHRITQNGFFGLLLTCGAKLKSLAIVKCFGIRDMACGVNFPESCSTSLRSLAVSNCPGFGNVNLAMVTQLCPQLTEVDLSGLPGVTDAVLLPLIRNNKAGLEKLNLRGCINVTDEPVLVLTELHGDTLELLNLDGCGKITDASLTGIADNCFTLADLYLSRCAISDIGVKSLACSCLNLEHLSLSGCSMVSDKSLIYLAKSGQNMYSLNVQHCNAISQRVINMLPQLLCNCNLLF